MATRNQISLGDVNFGKNMHGHNLSCTNSEEGSLLLKLRFACLLSQQENLMLDAKVINSAVNLLKYLQTAGPSPQFKASYIQQPNDNKALLGPDFRLRIGTDLKSIHIERCAITEAVCATTYAYACDDE